MNRLVRAILRPDHTLRILVEVTRTLVAISRMAIDEPLKALIRRSYLKTFVLKRYDARHNVADIAGYRVRFTTYRSLAYLFEEVFLNQAYCVVTTDRSPFIVDCGSNIGMSVLYFKMVYPTSTIVAFEPDQEAFSCLAANITGNGLQDVEAHCSALSRRDGKLNLYYDKDNPGSLLMSTVAKRMPKQTQLVEGVRLSQFIDRPVDLLKLDVEGAEGDVLQDLAREARLHHIRQMIIEYHHHIDEHADALSHILRLLEETGFGYQIQGARGRPLMPRQYQDILIYAYRKERPA